MTTCDGDDSAGGMYVSAGGLRARGWTRGMVRRLLGEPDLLRVHPRFRETGPPIRLYRVERVAAAEQSEEFRTVAAAAARRSLAARAAAQRRRRDVLTRIAAEPIDVPRLAPHRLTDLAVGHRNRRDAERAYERWDHVPEPATAESADPGALDRWEVDYLRHRLIRYDELLTGWYGSTGRGAAEELLRRRVYEAIAEAYPHLERECERRLCEQEGGPPPE
ncbi:hypothetical protein [Streptomyces sp. NPDC048277]|uniref:hypothetical protein n=1 Tax=Streptomyces sp. NPDC048277 TaxID=3155027 RepID=UPI0033E93BB4